MLSDSRGATPSSPSSPPYPDYRHHHHHHHHHPAPAYQQHAYKHASPPSSPSSASSTARCCSLRGGGGCCAGPPPARPRPPGRRPSAWCCCCYCPAAVANSAFSSVGVCLLVLAYTLLGAFTFMVLEGEGERPGGGGGGGKPERGAGVPGAEMRSKTVERLWSITEDLNILYKDNWTRLATDEVLKFQDALMQRYGAASRALAKKGGPGGGTAPAVEGSAAGGGVLYYNHMHHRWSFSSSFLYSLTVITTIGYGSVAPKTPWGKVITIVYALIGIPLMLVYLSTVGDVLARSFRRLYARLCGGGGGGGNSKAGAAAAKAKLAGSAERYLSTGYTPAAATAKGHNNILAADGSAVKMHHYHPHTEGGAGEDLGKPGRSASTAVLDCGGDGLGASSTSSLDPSGKYRRHEGAPGGCGGGDPVRIPISLCLLIVVLYICGGALLFHWLENWTFLEGSYFCFTSLGTIGFGDLIPGLLHGYESQQQSSPAATAAASAAEQLSVFASSAYILVGMALIAMCFNLVQDEVVIVVRKMGQYFGVNGAGGGPGGGGGGGGRGGGDDDEDLMLDVLDGEGIAMSVVSTTGSS